MLFHQRYSLHLDIRSRLCWILPASANFVITFTRYPRGAGATQDVMLLLAWALVQVEYKARGRHCIPKDYFLQAMFSERLFSASTTKDRICRICLFLSKHAAHYVCQGNKSEGDQEEDKGFDAKINAFVGEEPSAPSWTKYFKRPWSRFHNTHKMMCKKDADKKNWSETEFKFAKLAKYIWKMIGFRVKYWTNRLETHLQSQQEFITCVL